VCLPKTPVLKLHKARVFVSIYVEGTQDSEAQDPFSRLIFRKAKTNNEEGGRVLVHCPVGRKTTSVLFQSCC
jgi:hypothetical protein